jgi:hypothetical protein
MPRITVGTENSAPIEIQGSWTRPEELNQALLEFLAD